MKDLTAQYRSLTIVVEGRKNGTTSKFETKIFIRGTYPVTMSEIPLYERPGATTQYQQRGWV